MCSTIGPKLASHKGGFMCQVIAPCVDPKRKAPYGDPDWISDVFTAGAWRPLPPGIGIPEQQDPPVGPAMGATPSHSTPPSETHPANKPNTGSSQTLALSTTGQCGLISLNLDPNLSLAYA